MIQHQAAKSVHEEFIDTLSNLRSRWWAIALRGMISILLGLVAIFYPLTTMLSLVFIFAAYLMMDGIFALVAALAIKGPSKARTWLIIEALIDLSIGVVIFTWPGISLLAMVLLTASWAFLTGFFMITAGFTGERHRADWWFILGGLVSLIFGVLMMIAPIMGAIIMTWWLGAYALAFGFVLLTLAADLWGTERQHATQPSF